MPLPSSNPTHASRVPLSLLPHTSKPPSSSPTPLTTPAPTPTTSSFPPQRPTHKRAQSSRSRPRKDSLARPSVSEVLRTARKRKVLRVVERLVLAPLPREAEPSAGGAWCYVVAGLFWVSAFVLVRAVCGWGAVDLPGPALAVQHPPEAYHPPPLPPLDSPQTPHLPPLPEHLHIHPEHEHDSSHLHAHEPRHIPDSDSDPDVKAAKGPWYHAGLLKTLRKAHKRIGGVIPKLSVPGRGVPRAQSGVKDGLEEGEVGDRRNAEPAWSAEEEEEVLDEHSSEREAEGAWDRQWDWKDRHAPPDAEEVVEEGSSGDDSQAGGEVDEEAEGDEREDEERESWREVRYRRVEMRG